MIPAPVGFQLPRVRRRPVASSAGPGRPLRGGISVTKALLVAIAIPFVIEVVLGGPQALFNPSAEAPVSTWGRCSRSRSPSGAVLAAVHGDVPPRRPVARGAERVLLLPVRPHGRVGLRKTLDAADLPGGGFLASVASYAFGPVTTLAVGASGAIAAVFGAFIAYNYRRRNSAANAANLRMALTVIVLNAADRRGPQLDRLARPRGRPGRRARAGAPWRTARFPPGSARSCGSRASPRSPRSGWPSSCGGPPTCGRCRELRSSRRAGVRLLQTDRTTLSPCGPRCRERRRPASRPRSCPRAPRASIRCTSRARATRSSGGSRRRFRDVERVRGPPQSPCSNASSIGTGEDHVGPARWIRQRSSPDPAFEPDQVPVVGGDVDHPASTAPGWPTPAGASAPSSGIANDHTRGSFGCRGSKLHQLAHLAGPGRRTARARSPRTGTRSGRSRRSRPCPRRSRTGRPARALDPPRRTREMSHPWTSPPEFAKYTIPSRNATEVLDRRRSSQGRRREQLGVEPRHRQDDLRADRDQAPVVVAAVQPDHVEPGVLAPRAGSRRPPAGRRPSRRSRPGSGRSSRRSGPTGPWARVDRGAITRNRLSRDPA